MAAFFLPARNRGLARREEDERSDRPNDPNEQTADFKAGVTSKHDNMTT